MMWHRVYNGYYGGGRFRTGYFFMHDNWLIIAFMALLGILAVVLTVVLITKLVRKNRGPAKNSEALELLNARLAKGEITEEDYLKRKKLLGK